MKIAEKQTIAAVSTAMSPGGISIVRISGPEAFEVADKVYRSKSGKKKLSAQKSHTIHYGYIFDGNEIIDEVLVSVFRAPRTYTAEDTVEINCHGGVLVTRKVLQIVLKNGALPAQPGEFTKRAFLNGRIDLSRAEAVMDLISAKNQFALTSSVGQLQGNLAQAIQKQRKIILDIVAYIEAALDDPEHISLDGYSKRMKEELLPVQKQVRRMIQSFEDGKLLAEGIRTVILGKPNAGKSSLLNLFSGHERAIVTNIAGTTRDILEEQLTIGKIGFMMIDTAGIRQTQDEVEKIGVQRAKKAAESADLILYVADASRELDDDDKEIMELMAGKRSIILLNKSDLEPKLSLEELKALWPKTPVISISAATSDGLDDFKDLVQKMFYHGELEYNDEVILTNIRQKHCMESALASLDLVLSNLEKNIPEDLLTIDLMDAYESLGHVIGEEVEEDLVNRIFEKFCMGK